MRRLFFKNAGILMADLTVASMKLAVGQMSLKKNSTFKEADFTSELWSGRRSQPDNRGRYCVTAAASGPDRFLHAGTDFLGYLVLVLLHV